MAALVMTKAMFKRYGIELRRYYVNTVSTLASVYLIFLLIFLGLRAFAGGGADFGDTTSGLVVGFMVWFLAVFAYSELSWVLMQEAQQGTLEQLSMSPLGLKRVLIGRLAASLVFDVAIMFLFLLLMMLTTGKWLSLNLASVLPLLLVTVMGVFGIGFIMGGLALVFKRIQQSFQILQFIFVALVAAPVQAFPLVKFLPLSWGTHLINRAMIGGESIAQMPLADLLLLAGNSVFYFTLGLLVFGYFEKVARDRGLLGHY